MGRLTRTFEWSRTPVGPARDWPQSLKTAVSIMLGCQYPLLIWWGKQLIHFYNDAYISVLGKRHPAALGRPAPEVWAETWPTVGPQAEAVMEEGRSCWNEERLIVMTRNGFPEEVYMTFSYGPILDDAGRVGGVFCACTEDTQRVLNRRRLRNLRALADRSSQAKNVASACESAAAVLAENPNDLPFTSLYLLSGDGRRALLAACSGQNRDTAASPSVIDLDNRDAVWPFDQVIVSGESITIYDLPEKFGRLTGGPWPEPCQQAVVMPVAGAGRNRLAGFLVAGVSPRLVLSQSYRDFLNLVSRQVATAIASARAYEEERHRAESLSEIDRVKTAFFSNVSHEFRTPLSLIIGPLEDALATPERALRNANLEAVHRNALRLLKLVDTLLDFSSIEAGRIQASFAPTDLAALTVDLAGVFRSAVEKAGLTLTIDCPALEEEIYVDRDMWEKIVLNLLSNAFKFTFEGEIAVSLRRVENHVELAVRDTGTGIPRADMPHLFDRFHRIAGARARTRAGTGIGLALVQELVKLHQGTIKVASRLGEGSVFRVRIPRGKNHLSAGRIGSGRSRDAASPGAKPYIEEALGWLPDMASHGEVAMAELTLPDRGMPQLANDFGYAARVLIADDNADMRRYLVKLLSPLCEVHAVADGGAAWQAAKKNMPNLVLADVMMPGMDGFELLERLRREDRTRETAVILLSACAGEEARVEGMRAGADDYLVKPFSARELVARVGTHLKLARQRRESRQALQSSNQELNEYAYALTHNVKAPFRAVQNYASFLSEDLGGRLEGDTKQYLDGLQMAVHQANQQFQDLESLYRIKNYPVEFAPLDMRQLIDEIASLHQDAPDRRLVIAERWPVLWGERFLLRQILVELINNGFKYNRAALKEVAVDWQPASRERFEIVVRDNGIGIEPQYQVQIFEIFKRLHTDFEYDGTGIGLAIVRRAAQKIGGELRLESAVGKGSAFYVSLPKAMMVESPRSG